MTAEPSGPGSSRTSAALTLAAAGLLAGAVFFGGASGDGSVVWVGGAAIVVAGLALAAASVGRLPLPSLTRPAGIAAAAFGGLVVMAGISMTWSIAADQSWSALDKAITYAGFFVVGLALVSLGTNTTRTVACLLAVITGAALAWALAGKIIPGLAAGDASRVARLHSPVGYWNGLALLADAALGLGVWLAVTASGRRAVRASGAILVYLAVLGGLLTASRAGVLGGLLVLALWLWLGSRRVESAAVAAAAGVPAALVAAWAFTRAALVDTGRTHADRVHDGAIFGVLGVAGAVLAVGAVLVGLPRLLPGRERVAARSLVAGAVAAVVVGLAVTAAVSGNPFASAAHGLSRSECSNTASRFGCTNNNRLRWWREALDVFAARPAGGAGAGTFEVARTRYRKTGDPVSEPHSVPLQLLAGVGVAGGVLLLVLAGGTVLALRRPLRGLDGPERLAAVALAGLPLAYSLHALVDFDIDFIAVSAPAALTLGVLLGVGRPLVRGTAGVVPALAAVAVAATLVVALVLPWSSSRKVDASYAATSKGSFRTAVAAANDARSLDPVSLGALQALAFAYQGAGRYADARAVFLRATRQQPENAETWYQLGIFEYLFARDMCAAYQALNHSYTLDPRNTHWTRGGELDKARAAVDDPDNPACGRA